MKKMLFFIESLAGGGAEKVLTELVYHLDKNKYDITVATVVDLGVYKEEVKKQCKYFSFLSDPTESNSIIEKILYKFKYKLIYKLPAAWVYKMFIKGSYDMEIGFVEGFATKVISKSTNRKSRKLAWVHVDPINWSYADQYYTSLQDQVKSYKSFSKVVCVSESVKEAFGQKFYRDENMIVKYNPVDSKTIVKKSSEECELNKSGKFLLGSIGRLTHEKGYDRLLKVINKLKDDGLDFELWILGEGMKRQDLEQYILDNHLSDSVKLLGFQKNPYKYIKHCDLFISSSRAEGFSLAIAEAMILGLPIISTDCAGPNELLEYGKYGMLTENDEESLYVGLKSLISNNTLLMEYRDKSLERKQIFDIEIAVREIEDVLG
jgi:glycosyltransferase involved in cell wall biosynthesis